MTEQSLATTGPWHPPGPVVGVDLGLTNELGAEPGVALLHDALVAHGLGEACWIITVPVGRIEGREHVALALALPALSGRVPDELLEVVGDVVDNLLATDRAGTAAPEHGPTEHGHAHGPGHTHFGSGAAGLTCGDAHRGPEQQCVDAAEAQASVEYAFAGRAVVFPGRDELVGTVTLDDAARVGLRVVSLDAREHPGETPLVTRDHVRPRLERGAWVLHVQPAIGGTVVPFEERDPKQCCQDG